MEQIQDKRKKELKVLFWQKCYAVLIVAVLYFFPIVLQTTALASYIGISRKDLDLSTAFMVVSVLQIMADPLRELPMFFGSFFTVQVSMNRI